MYKRQPAHRPAVSIPVDGEWQGFPSVAAAEQAAYADFKAASHRDAQNFHITDDALGVGGAKAKFRANMAAIRLLQELEFEGLQASPEQQEILSRYVGWGGLADAFDENKPNWSDEFAELYATCLLYTSALQQAAIQSAGGAFCIRTIKKQPFSDTDTDELFGMLCTKCLICRNIRRKLTTLICNSCEDSGNRFGSVFRLVIALAGG